MARIPRLGGDVRWPDSSEPEGLGEVYSEVGDGIQTGVGGDSSKVFKQAEGSRNAMGQSPPTRTYSPCGERKEPLVFCNLSVVHSTFPRET